MPPITHYGINESSLFPDPRKETKFFVFCVVLLAALFGPVIYKELTMTEKAPNPAYSCPE